MHPGSRIRFNRVNLGRPGLTTRRMKRKTPDALRHPEFGKDLRHRMPQPRSARGSSLRFFGGFEGGAFLGDDADELLQAVVPVGQQRLRVRAAGLLGVIGDQLLQLGDVLVAMAPDGRSGPEAALWKYARFG
jgi:hypothetical protein